MILNTVGENNQQADSKSAFRNQNKDDNEIILVSLLVNSAQGTVTFEQSNEVKLHLRYIIFNLPKVSS